VGLIDRTETSEFTCEDNCSLDHGFGGTFVTDWNDKPTTYQLVNKENVKEQFGQPNAIESKSDGSEVWKYERTAWRGYIVFAGLPLPFLLPIGTDTLDFEFDKSGEVTVTENSTYSDATLCSAYKVVDTVDHCLDEEKHIRFAM